MLSYKKRHAAKADPVKEILSRCEARQNQTGLSLYTKRNTLENILAPQQRQGKNTYSSIKKSTMPRFADVTAARQNAHKRLKAGTSGTDECGYCETRRGRGPFTSSQDWTNNHVINVTFPPAASRSVDAVGTRHFKKGFSGNSTSDLRGSELNLNPFGYMRRTQAFEPTQMSYVVEWPKTWPLKIMSFQQRSQPDKRRKPTRASKIKAFQGVASKKGHAQETAVVQPGTESSNRAVSKPVSSELPPLKDWGKPSVKAPGRGGANITGTKEVGDPSRPRQSREFENRAASSSVAESTYIALQNDDTVALDSAIHPEPVRKHTQQVTAPPSSPCVPNDVEKCKKEDGIERRDGEGKSPDPFTVMR